ncbi:hypothetical protein F4779DRAFT_618953 [Xylariaceae sp. FL0662B]|nr:hypothetical protein F4779DRAFT_618953 [Xylariaceae sp. FL0662B]
MANDARRQLRILTSPSFLVAFPLCLAHGVVSHSPVPATGLVPLAFSAAANLFLVSRQPKPRTTTVEQGDVRDDETPAETGPETAHPVLTFAFDAVLAAALMIVLVFTWVRLSSRAELAMLAAYSTIPLLVSFLIHLYLAVRALSIGLALHDLTQWMAWQIVPPDCPDCGHRLRPSSPPSAPWFQSLPKIKVPTMPSIQTPSWKAPAWLRGRRYAPIPVDEQEEDEGRYYRDEPDTGGPSTRVQEPEVVDVVGRKHKDSPVINDEPASQPEPEPEPHP